jgi:hypothetical protein
MEISINGVEEFKRAIERNPQVAREEVGKFLVRATAKYKQTIKNKPWRVGQVGGGVPVSTGNLRDQHHTEIKDWIARIYVMDSVDYRWAIHEGTKKMKARPWLDYAVSNNQQAVDKLGDAMLGAIVNNLAK